MKTKKPKRISALKSEEYLDGKKPVKCYLLRQSDIRALAEQITKDYWSARAWIQTEMHPMLYALKRAGMTPGKAGGEMTPPTPAAVRAAMKETSEGCTAEESRALCADNRLTDELLRDHIRAIAQEMRKESAAARVNTVDPFTAPAVRDAELAAAQMLKGFADKLEGNA